ncbi:MAG: Ku protein [Salinibacter sp.]
MGKMKASWTGSMIVNGIPLAMRMTKAVESDRPNHVHLHHKPCGSRIQYRKYCGDCEQVVNKDELMRAVESEDEPVPVGAPNNGGGNSSSSLQIKGFVPANLNWLRLDKPYYLSPDFGKKKSSANDELKALYKALLETMRKRGVMALGEVVMRSKMHHIAILPVRPTLLAYTLRPTEDIRQMELDLPEGSEIPEKTQQVVDTLVGKMTNTDVGLPETNPDKEQVRQALESGEPVEVEETTGTGDLSSITEALQASIEEG